MRVTSQIISEQVGAFLKGDRIELDGAWFLVMETKSQGLFRKLALMPLSGEERGTRVEKVVSGKRVVPMFPRYGLINKEGPILV